MSTSFAERIQHKIDTKTKPLGALGQLESLAKQIACLQQTESPSLDSPTMIVFAADHGLADEGVSAYPKEVTQQMVLNFVQGGAAINVFSRLNGLALQVVDAGVAADFDKDLPIMDCKVGLGTDSSLSSDAITQQQLDACREHAVRIVGDLSRKGCKVVGFGEMGIGNTSAASLIQFYLSGEPLADIVGRGTGLDDQGVSKKLGILQQVAEFHGELSDPESVLKAVGGFEIAMMAYAMIAAANNNILVLVDGYIASSAALVATHIAPAARNAMVFCHQSEEHGHRAMLQSLDAQPLLDMGMRLGEGSACALAFPLVQAAVGFLNDMASFESAEVSEKL